MDHRRNSVHPVAARVPGPRLSSGFPKVGNLVHLLIVIAIILVVLHLLGVL